MIENSLIVSLVLLPFAYFFLFLSSRKNCRASAPPPFVPRNPAYADPCIYIAVVINCLLEH